MRSRHKLLLINGFIVFTGIGVLFLTNCKKFEESSRYDNYIYKKNAEISQKQKEKNYTYLKENIRIKQHAFIEEFKNQNRQTALLALAKDYTYKLMTDTLLPYWYDTRWDYNGTTQTPGRGEIACGYFVTTSLRDAGFKVQRAKLAQQASSNIMKSVCGEQNIHIIGHNNIKALKNYLLEQKDGLFIIGLDNHVGFVHKKGTEIWIIHSNGVSGRMMVERENLTESQLVLNSQAFYLAPLTNNTHAHKFWLRGQDIPTLN